MRRHAALLLILALLLFLPARAEEAAENLIVNGDFEAVDAFDLPEGWNREMWYSDPGVSELDLAADGADGGLCVRVSNVSENDARFAQDVPVEPDTYYRLSCRVRAENCGAEASGAGISIRDTFVSSDYAYDTEGEWVALELVGRTGPDQTSMGVLLRVGGYSSLNTGTAWFDDVRLERLDELPADVSAADFTPYDYSAARKAEADTQSEDEPARNTEAYLLLTAIYALAVVGFARKKRRGPEADTAASDGRAYIAVMILALAIRVALALGVRGYNTDITCFEAWSDRIFTQGVGGFYAADYFCDYPPAYMLMLWPAALLRRLFGAGYNSPAHILLIKLLPIAFDLAAARLIYRYAGKRLGSRAALLLAAFYALNPAVFVDSAAWGQIDSVLALLLALCAITAAEGRYMLSLPVFALAVLVKPQALLFGPLGLAAVLLNILLTPRKARLPEGGTGRGMGQEAKEALFGLLIALALMYFTALPFCAGSASGLAQGVASPFKFLYNIYADALQKSYPHFSLNTLNLYTLLGLNWAELSLHPTLQKVGWGLFVFSYAYCAVMYLVSRDRKKLYLCGAALLILICTFGPKIHERYVFPALLLLVLAYVEEKDLRVLIAAVALTVTLFLNEALVLQGALTSANYGHLHDSENWLNYPVCVVNIALALMMLWTCFDLCVRKRAVPMPAPEAPAQDRPGIAAKTDHKLRLNRWDYLLMAGVTLVYSVAAFVNLGSTAAPQTSWVSSAAGESVVFDLGEPRTFRMTYYGGICDCTFGVELSNDGENWTERVRAVYRQGEIFRWLFFVPSDGDLKPLYGQTLPTEDGGAYLVYPTSLDAYPYQTARYVRLTAEQAGLVLSEVAFLDGEGTPLSIRALTRSGADADASGAESDPLRLMDEQDVVPDHPSYYNSTYFDEIYHARTAYEHLHGMEAYEWTHPPLGKTLMMLGIRIFGMTPFGWRFMGALMGVLMLPALYLMVKQLTKRTDLSAVAMFLMAVDSMHFTQTRIATIDSYAVFFIMVMYLFMFRYSQMSWNRQSLARTLVPLGLSGLFMGFAWATKWIGLYASVGLAAVFFYTLYLRIREYPGRDGSFAAILLGFAGGLLCALGAAGCGLLGRMTASGSGISALMPEVLSGLPASGWYLAMGILLAFAAVAALLMVFLLAQRTEYQREFWRNFIITILACLVFFVAIPLLIYYFSYYWQLKPEAGGLNLQRVIELQRQMLGYHAGLSGDTHFFRSPWYQWPVIAWPMWYYSGTAYMPAGVVSSISCMGNPAVWWAGLAALVFVAARLGWMRKAPRNYLLVIIGFASQFLPWVLVPRSTFIYHYFASVPFIIIATVLALDALRQRSEREYRALTIILCAAALILFVGFYPLESGTPVSRSYAMLLRWFDWYNF